MASFDARPRVCVETSGKLALADVVEVRGWQGESLDESREAVRCRFRRHNDVRHGVDIHLLDQPVEVFEQSPLSPLSREGSPTTSSRPQRRGNSIANEFAGRLASVWSAGFKLR
jgi:hypothetical protein